MSKGTTIRGIRVPDTLWDAAKAKAELEGRSVSDVIREALEDYVSKRRASAASGRESETNT
jgi:predicted transcriptional regulator